MTEEMRDDCTALIDANDWLETILSKRKRLLDLAPKLFNLLREFSDDDQDETDTWIVEMYWKIVKRKIENFAINLHDTKQEAQDFSVAEEFIALKSEITKCLTDIDSDIEEEWERLEARKEA